MITITKCSVKCLSALTELYLLLVRHRITSYNVCYTKLLRKTEVFNSMFCSIIYVGEESGSLDNILISISSYYDDEAESAIQRLVSMLEPILIIVLGGFVGLIIASILPALYSSLGSIQ